MAKEETLSSQLIYEGRAVKLRVDTVEMPSGRQTKREIVEHSDCVAIIAIDDNDNVLLVNQFRKSVEKELLEIPAGGIEPGEDPVNTVQPDLLCDALQRRRYILTAALPLHQSHPHPHPQPQPYFW